MGSTVAVTRAPESLHAADMAKDVSRNLRAPVFLLAILLAACSEPMTWIRADGRMDRGLAQLEEIDILACHGDETGKTSGADSVIPAPLRLKKSDADGFAACMAARGYSRVPVSEADAASRK